MNSTRLEGDEMRILLVEDDAEIGDVMARGMRAAGFVVDVATDGRRGLQLARGRPYGAILLDLMLPLIDGMQLCAEARAAGISTPILMVTAKDAVRDRVLGLEAGADDYLVKPFDFAELLARVRALLRRDKVHRARVLRIGHLKLDTGSRQVWVGGEPVALVPREFDLLEALAANEGRVLTRDAIQDHVWGNDDRYSNVVNVQVKRLRSKIERPGLPKLIHTVHGIGYSLRRPDGASL